MQRAYAKREEQFTSPVMREIERVVTLRVVDEFWMDHIDAMDDLRQGIRLRAYAQTDPVIEYKREGFDMFEAMNDAIKEEIVRRVFLVRIKTNEEIKRQRVAKVTGEGAGGDKTVKRQPVVKKIKVGPNDPCPCGSGKKYKKCCRDKDLAAERGQNANELSEKIVCAAACHQNGTLGIAAQRASGIGPILNKARRRGGVRDIRSLPCIKTYVSHHSPRNT